MPYERSAMTMVQNSETLALKPFAMTWVLNTSFRVHIRLPRMVLLKGKRKPCVRWLVRCLMIIGLREGFGLRRWIPRAMFQTGSTSKCKKKTCFELLHGRTTKVSHFHVVGCKCFILKKGKKLDKFEARSVDSIFFGYASHSRAYRVLNLETNQIVETCEITFDECKELDAR
jgi:hypothetical protein